MTTDNVLPDDVRKARALELLGQGRLEDARSLLAELCRNDQRDVEVWFTFSTANGYLGRFEDVVLACRKALEIEPGHLPALNNLASALAAMGNHHEAAAAFAEILRRAPDNPAVLNNYGHALALSGQKEEAREILEDAVRKQPFYAEAHYNLAILLDQMGLAAQALLEYEQAAALKPGLPGIEARIASLRESIGRRV